MFFCEVYYFFEIIIKSKTRKDENTNDIPTV